MSKKMCISLTQEQRDFLDIYKVSEGLPYASDVIKLSLQLLKEIYLEASYLQANKEIDCFFEVANLDGIDENEAW